MRQGTSPVILEEKGDLLKSTRVSNRCPYAAAAIIAPYISPASRSRSEFLSEYFGLCSQPIFEIVTVFIAPFLEKPIGTCSHYFFGQFKGAFVEFRGWMWQCQTSCISDDVVQR
jgi:hypothetical protein